MDFILENEGKPVPDLSSVSAAGPAASASGGGDAPMDVDEDQEELAALQAAYGKAQVAPAAGSAQGGEPAEAKVRVHSARHKEERRALTLWVALGELEHQVLAVRQGLQEHRARELPRGEERARPVRRVHGGGAPAVCLRRSSRSLIYHRVGLGLAD